ncbi:four-carbon acid sugar kinase family protein [Pseudomonas citronellolis]|uniref:four-carbon acid sugar kinase family protein n=1 Tax=Pseudomonas citronellolis TaxID=53408 RepID=UPI0018DA0E52|nr:four-carbon acid sugar kinase family protein [Pseudomonas citronellolis]MBH3436325.1 four-carbon acid sugar kinase family protein [Pseudomonas citronellolis]
MTLLISADDLAGGAEGAGGFASRGGRSLVMLDARPTQAQVEVIAVDTDSRRLDAAQAAQRSVAAFHALARPGQRLYKKIDSTLRGNWAAEVAALHPLAGLALVAPAFPEMGRTVRAGQVLVHGAPLESTDTWRLEHADAPADMARMLGAAGLRVEHCALEQLRQSAGQVARIIQSAMERGVQALIFDAETAEDLRLLARETARAELRAFWVGSGGLARQITEAPSPSSSQTAAVETGHLPSQLATVVLAGSLSAVADRQCEELQRRSDILQLSLPPAVLRQGSEHADWPDWQAQVGALLEQGRDLLLRIGRDERPDPAEGALLSANLAALLKPHFHRVGGLVATGGETARAMLGAVGIAGLQLVGEIEAGSVLSHPLAPAGGHRPGIVTKAGAFGSPEALYRAWRHLRDAQQSPS